VEQNKIYQNVPLRDFNSWRVGGLAENFLICSDKEKLAELLRAKKIPQPITFIGLGSNTLFRDGGYRGTIIMLHKGISEVKEEPPDLIYAEAGLSCSKLSKFAAKSGYKNCAFFAGIPGTVGGALAMNAGCYGFETWNFVKQVLTIDMNGNQHIRQKEEFEIDYRYVDPKNKKEFFLAAWLEFEKGSKEVSEQEIKSLLYTRKESQPLNWPTGGSTFRNPENHYAAKLIEECQLKGYQIGGARVSEKHANFIINTGDASADDIERLIIHIQSEVYKSKHIHLETEVKIIGNKLNDH